MPSSRSSLDIDGRKLDSLRRAAGIRQKEVAEKAGVSKFTLSRWCSDGMHRIKRENAQALAFALGMELASLLAQAEPASRGRTQGVDGLLTPAENEWLQVYRGLDPLAQAKVRVAVERLIRGEASDA
jgi:transcriptional regulator with XRE-family HTH domain